jgi:hypothetical protein
MVTRRPLHPETESFAGLLLRHRGRTGLIQRDRTIVGRGEW